MTRYALFDDTVLNNPSTMITSTTDQEGGILRVKGGALIDGKLTRVTIIVMDESPMKISALAHLDTCVINCQDIIIEGEFSGEINAKGDVELGDSCRVKGKLNHSGRLLIDCTLADTVDLHIRKLSEAPKDFDVQHPNFFDPKASSVTPLAIGSNAEVS